MRFKHLSALLTIVATLTACSAAMVPTTSDPQGKILQAYELLQLSRPIPAKNLIDESFTIYKQRGDEKGLGYAYTALADYDQYLEYVDSRQAVGQMVPPRINMSKVISMPPNPNALDALRNAEQHYQQALIQEKDDSDYFSASNTYWRLSGVYARLRENEKVCEALDASYDMSVLAKKAHPNMQSETYGKFSTYKDLIDSAKKEIPCPSA